MYANWNAHYYANLEGRPLPVQVQVTPEGLQFQKPGSFTREVWPYAPLRQTLGRRMGEPVRLDYKTAAGTQALVFDNPEIMVAIAQFNAAAVARMTSRTGEHASVVTLLTLPILLILAAVLLIWIGFPLMSGAVARVIPVSWEERLGQMAFNDVKTCEEGPLTRSVEEITEKLHDAIPNSPYTYRVKVVNDKLVNAFAAPGGYIVVYGGLVSKTTRPEELAAVMAHELQHVEQRHSTKGIIRALGIGIFAALVLGDSTMGGLAVELTKLSFSRGDEEEADRRGHETLLRAKIDTRAMADMFRILQKETGDLPGVLTYMSTHPNVADRIREAEQRANDNPGSPEALLPGRDWDRIKNDCGK